MRALVAQGHWTKRDLSGPLEERRDLTNIPPVRMALEMGASISQHQSWLFTKVES